MRAAAGDAASAGPSARPSSVTAMRSPAARAGMRTSDRLTPCSAPDIAKSALVGPGAARMASAVARKRSGLSMGRFYRPPRRLRIPPHRVKRACGEATEKTCDA
jgi:hypothetical protein